jgi:phosphate transport system substrate-binding protein
MSSICNFNPSRTVNRITHSLALLVAGAFLAGCPAGKEPQVNNPAPRPANKILIRGSNTIGEELAPRLIAEYQKEHPNVSFDLEFKGTAYGIGSLLGGHCDIAGASKAIAKEQEEIARERGVEPKEHLLGTYTVAIVVNAANPASNLTSNQVASLFIGQVQNWKEVGGPDAPVHLYVRDPISGTHIGFKELAMANQGYGSGARLLTNYVAIVEGIAKDQNGIGYCGLDLAKHEGIKALSIDGVAPSIETVNQQKYPYARVLRLYTDGLKAAPETKQFIDFALSPRGQQIVAGMGYAPKP